MQSIEEIAISNYQTNMNYFKEKDEALFNKLTALELLLNDGRYPQQYELEYKDDYFDVLVLKSKQYLYATNSNLYSNELTSDITLKKNNQVCETFYNLKFSKEALKKANNSEAISRYATIAPIISYYDSFVTSEMHFKKIYKFMFIGVGLALHIPKIINKINPEILLIIEDSLELFRLSLFTCNYKETISNRVVHFSIGESNEEFKGTFEKFYENSSIRNQFLKFSLLSSIYENKIKEIQTLVVSRAEKCYSHERILYKNQKVLERIKQGYKFLNFSKKEQETFFKDKPFLVLGAGPSLHQNIEWLKENQNNFITIAVFASLKTLQKHGIPPDIVMQIDEKVPEGEKLLNSFENFNFLKNSLFIFSASLPDIFFETFEDDKIYLVEDRSYYMQEKLYIVASSVGEVAYSIPLIFNANKTYLLGLDLALTDDGITHSKEHHGTSQLDTSQANKVQTVTSLQQSVLKVKGNFRDEVITTPLLAMSIPKLNRYTKNLKSEIQKVFNLCNGAYFENTIPLQVQNNFNLKKINKTNTILDIQNLFNNYSTSSQENIDMKRREDQIETFYKYIQNFQDSASSNENQFINEYKKLLLSFLSSKESELKELLLVYYYNTSNYVTDFFNTKELNGDKKHTKKLKKIISIQLRKIINFYENTIKKDIK